MVTSELLPAIELSACSIYRSDELCRCMSLLCLDALALGPSTHKDSWWNPQVVPALAMHWSTVLIADEACHNTLEMLHNRPASTLCLELLKPARPVSCGLCLGSTQRAQARQLSQSLQTEKHRMVYSYTRPPCSAAASCSNHYLMLVL